jgi:hypothetical protein
MATLATKAPRAYVTGGAWAAMQPAIDACGDAPELWEPIRAGGPLDAPDWMPTGRRIVSHGHRFIELTSREA